MSKKLKLYYVTQATGSTIIINEGLFVARKKAQAEAIAKITFEGGKEQYPSVELAYATTRVRLNDSGFMGYFSMPPSFIPAKKMKAKAS